MGLVPLGVCAEARPGDSSASYGRPGTPLVTGPASIAKGLRVDIRDASADPIDDHPPYEGNGTADNGEAFSWEAILSAPNYADLIKTRQSARAREYRDKTNSLLKAGLVGALNAGDFPDAAAILRHGPAFSNATGQLADSNDKAAAIIDMITSPANPVAMFVLATIPLVAQIMRNHEKELAQVPGARKQAKATRKALKEARKSEEPRFTIKLLRWQIPVRWHSKGPDWRKVFAGFKSQTLDPNALAADVFTDSDVQKALEKMGVLVRAKHNDQS